MPDPTRLKTLIEAELQNLTHLQAMTAIRAHLVEPISIALDWDYGAPDQQFSGWLVFDDPTTDTEIVFCAEGFGPSQPWGLSLSISGRRPMGPDSGWSPTFVGIWLESYAAGEVEIWAVCVLDHGASQWLTPPTTLTAAYSELNRLAEQQPGIRYAVRNIPLTRTPTSLEPGSLIGHGPADA